MIDPTAASSVNTHATVAELLDPPGELPIYDIGAGRGNFTWYLTTKGYQVVAFDIDPADYRDFGYSDAPFVAANFDEDFPVPESSAGGAVAIEVLEHLESPLRAVRLMATALAPGGFLVVTTPNIMSWGSRIELLVRGHHEDFDDHSYFTNGHISPVSLTQLKRLGGRVGLTVEAVTYNVGKLPIPKLHHRYPLTHPLLRTQAFGESLIVKFRKTGSALEQINRG